MPTEREAQFRKMVEAHPESPMVHFSLGKLLLEERRYPEAVESLRAAVRMQPDYAAALVSLGDALLGAGRKHEAREVLEDARAVAVAQKHPSLAEEIEGRIAEL
jgi:uncharacterized protein HemY